MDKDKIGLIKYIVLILTISALSLLLGFLMALLIMASRVVANDGVDIFTIFLILFLITPFVYIISLVLITRFAIKQHWSEYLDTFFNNVKLNTLILFLSVLITYLYCNLYNLIDSALVYYLCLGVAPAYVIIYITNLCILLGKYLKK